MSKRDIGDLQKFFSLHKREKIFKSIVLINRQRNFETESQVRVLYSRGPALHFPGFVQPQGSALVYSGDRE